MMPLNFILRRCSSCQIPQSMKISVSGNLGVLTNPCPRGAATRGETGWQSSLRDANALKKGDLMQGKPRRCLSRKRLFCALGCAFLRSAAQFRALNTGRRRTEKEKRREKGVPDVLERDGRNGQTAEKAGAAPGRRHQNKGYEEMYLGSDRSGIGETMSHKPGHVSRHGLGVCNFAPQPCGRPVPRHLRFHGECNCQHT